MFLVSKVSLYFYNFFLTFYNFINYYFTIVNYYLYFYIYFALCEIFPLIFVYYFDLMVELEPKDCRFPDNYKLVILFCISLNFSWTSLNLWNILWFLLMYNSIAYLSYMVLTTSWYRLWVISLEIISVLRMGPNA